MATKEYRIIFENANAKMESPVASNKDAPDDSVENTAENLTKGLKGYASLNYAVSVADRVLSAQINTVELRTGHQELQQRMQFAYGVAKQGVGIVSGAIAGGTMGGAIGAVIGAVVGVADTMINMGIKSSQINMRKEIENQELYFNRIRAGAGQDRTGKTQ